MTSWTVAHQAPLSMEILQARILEWVAMPSPAGFIPTQGLNPCLPHCRQILYHLSHQGSPRILEWVACVFSRGPSQPRNQTGLSCTTWVLSLEPPGKPCKPFSSVQSLSCVQLCDSMDCIVHGILQARILEWVAVPFSRGSSQPRDRTQVSCVAGGSFTS